jgi:hypothetical protein
LTVCLGVYAFGSHLLKVPHLPNKAINKAINKTIGKERREERLRRWQELPELPHKTASFASSAELRLVLHVLSCFESITLPFLKTVAYLLHYLLSPVHSSGSLSPHPQSHATLVRRTMTTISKDAQQSSYPYVMDNRFTTPWTDDKRHFTVR